MSAPLLEVRNVSKRFPGVKPMYFYFLGGLMIPLQLAIVPLFFELRNFGLLNSRLGLWLVYVSLGLPFSIFVLTGFFKTLPSSVAYPALQFRAPTGASLFDEWRTPSGS